MKKRKAPGAILSRRFPVRKLAVTAGLLLAAFAVQAQVDPADAVAYFDRGLAWESKGDYDKAVADYNEALRLNPDFAGAYNNRGVAYFYKEDYRHARADWEQALRLDPNDAIARNNLERPLEAW